MNSVDFWTYKLLPPLGAFVVAVGFVVLWTLFLRFKRAREAAVLDEIRRRHLQPLYGETRANLTPPAKDNTMTIKFTDVSLRLKDAKAAKPILRAVTGVLEAGKTTAIMGPSGSGKTSLLTVLAGRTERTMRATGTIEINGKIDTLQRYKKLLGFVPQEDVMMRSLTVRENLEFSALTRLPVSLSHAEKIAVVDRVIKQLNIEHIQFSEIGDEEKRGISGGQRKRVNLGLELVADPSILLLDEPTSGMDAAGSMDMCEALGRTAKSGVTIAAVIHQPRYEIFRAFDNCLLLGVGGKTVYSGPTAGATEYFHHLGFVAPPHVNLADFLLDIIAGEVKRPGHTEFHPSQLPKFWKRNARAAIAGLGSHRLRASASPRLTTSAESSRSELLSSTEPVAASAAVPSILTDSSSSLVLSAFGRAEDKGDVYTSMRIAPSAQTTKQIVFASAFLLCLLVFPLLAPLSLYPLPALAHLYVEWLRNAGLVVSILGSVGWVFALMFGVHFRFTDSLSTLRYVHKVMFFQLSAFALTVCFSFLLFFLYRIYSRKNLRHSGHVFCGCLLGPVFVVLLYIFHAERRQRYLASAGAAVWILFWGIVALSIWGFPNHGGIPYQIFLYLLLPLTGIGILFVVWTRSRNQMAQVARETPGFIPQTWLVYKRAIVLQTRSLSFIFVQLALPTLAGLFVGVVYYGIHYQRSVLDKDFGGKCPSAVPSVACALFTFPVQDPSATRTPMACLALALAAIASSLYVFGSNHSVYLRENRSGLSADAFFWGKSLAHLHLELLASLLFSIMYYAFTYTLVSFWLYWLLFSLIYSSVCGLGFLVSLFVSQKNNQLVGVLAILSFMMFSGSSPTLIALKENKLIPLVLYFPSYGSLFRWVQEALYLMEVLPYKPSAASLGALFGYENDQLLGCWLMAFVLGYLFRLCAWVKIATSEE